MDMYNPFVVACNYALDELSHVEVPGLPEFSDEKQIVFVRNHDRSVRSHHHNRECRVRPDIVLLRWKALKELSRTPSPSYSVTHEGDICTSDSNLRLFWNHVRSTVEVKFGTFHKRDRNHNEWAIPFVKEFEAINESKAYTALIDRPQPRFIQELLPNNTRKCARSGGFLLLICLGSCDPNFRTTCGNEKSRDGREHTDFIDLQAQADSGGQQRK